MESKEKEIEEMMLAVPQKIVAFDMNPKGQHLYGEQRKEIAEALYNAGYRKTFTSDLASDTQKAYKEGYEKGFNAKLTSDFVRYAQKQAVKEFAEKLKANEGLMITNAFDLGELINATLKEFLNE